MTRTVYPKKYAHGFCFAVLCCGYTLTDFPISIRLTSVALWQSNDCPSASKATLMNIDKYFMWIHYERLHNHNKAKHNKTVCIILGIYCIYYTAYCHCLVEEQLHLANWIPCLYKGGVQVTNNRMLVNQQKCVVWSKNYQIVKLDTLHTRWARVQHVMKMYLCLLQNMSFVILAQLSFYSVQQIQSVCCYLPNVWVLNQSIWYFGI